MRKKLIVRNRKPTHPGAILREDVLPSLNMTQSELANRLGISRRSISQILNEFRPITPDVAIRLAYFLGTSPESWLKMQQALDVWVLQRKNSRIYEQIEKIA